MPSDQLSNMSHGHGQSAQASLPSCNSLSVSRQPSNTALMLSCDSAGQGKLSPSRRQGCNYGSWIAAFPRQLYVPSSSSKPDWVLGFLLLSLLHKRTLRLLTRLYSYSFLLGSAPGK